MQTFLWNQDRNELGGLLNAELTTAIRLDIAVAFLKQSGFVGVKDQIKGMLARGCAIRIVVGTDFWLTEPEPLDWLIRESQESSNCQLYLVNQQPASTFHPKVFLLEQEQGVTVIVGSSNLTNGGLTENWEGNLVLHLDSNAPLLQEIRGNV